MTAELAHSSNFLNSPNYLYNTSIDPISSDFVLSYDLDKLSLKVGGSFTLMRVGLFNETFSFQTYDTHGYFEMNLTDYGNQEKREEAFLKIHNIKFGTPLSNLIGGAIDAEECGIYLNRDIVCKGAFVGQLVKIIANENESSPLIKLNLLDFDLDYRNAERLFLLTLKGGNVEVMGFEPVKDIGGLNIRVDQEKDMISLDAVLRFVGSPYDINKSSFAGKVQINNVFSDKYKTILLIGKLFTAGTIIDGRSTVVDTLAELIFASIGTINYLGPIENATIKSVLIQNKENYDKYSICGEMEARAKLKIFYGLGIKEYKLNPGAKFGKTKMNCASLIPWATLASKKIVKDLFRTTTGHGVHHA